MGVSELPSKDAVLLLVIHRHDAHTTAVSFVSHVFVNLLNAQVAVIDTYKGSAHATPLIMDVEGSGAHSRSEKLRYNNVVAVNPGMYEVALKGKAGEVQTKNSSVALNCESYVILRTGVDAKE